MSSFDQARALFAQGRERDAIAFVEKGAAAGDPELLFTLAHWRLFGMYGPRDLSRAHQLLRKAAERGNVEAHRTRAMLIANGTGCRPDPDRAEKMLRSIAPKDPYSALQVQFLAGMMPAEAVKQVSREILSEDPYVEFVRAAFLPAECRYLMTLAEPRLQQSIVIDPATGRPVPHPVRTSSGATFGPTEEDLVVNAFNRRIADLTGTKASCGEPLHVLRYTPAQEYKPHVDALPDESNQRVLTALTYLNHAYSGGETIFPHLRLKVQGGTGDILIFRNALEGGVPDPRTQHAGTPVTEGTKWLASRWIRERPYDPFTVTANG